MRSPSIALTAPPASSPASASSAPPPLEASLSEHLKLLRDNFELMHRKTEAHAEMLQHQAGLLGETMDEMRQTLDLQQQMIGRHDELVERLGLVAAALTEMESRLMALLTKHHQPPSQS